MGALHSLQLSQVVLGGKVHPGIASTQQTSACHIYLLGTPCAGTSAVLFYAEKMYKYVLICTVYHKRA